MTATHSNSHDETVRASVIIVAAGPSQRMGAVDKIFAPILGLPLIAHTVRAFEQCSLIDSIVLVLDANKVGRGNDLGDSLGWHKVTAICAGGPRRQDSVRQGLDALSIGEWTIVHDGARPCVDRAIITRGLNEAGKTGAAIAAMPVRETIKMITPEQTVKTTLHRPQLRATQTPQIFRHEILREAHKQITDDVTDDATMVERLGIPVRLFPGSYTNIKVTTPEDLILAEALLQKGEQS